MAIRKAKRAGARIVLAFDGPSGAGKTYTALQFAWGLTGGDASKVGLIDTENRRGSLYADILKGSDGRVHDFWIDDLYSPFTPERYIAKILEFQQQGVEVLVIDSVSHEWAGIGGILEQVGKEAKAITGWKKWKPEHRRFVNTLLQCDMHIIVCVRSTNKVDWTDPKNPKQLGLMPVQQEEFMFEMTAAMSLFDGGKQRLITKCPKDLEAIFGKCGEWAKGYLTAKHGNEMRKWILGGEPTDQEHEKACNILRSHTEQGTRGVKAAWDQMPEGLRTKLGGQIPQDILDAAAAFDEMRKTPVSDINQAILSEGNDNTANG